MVDFFWLKSFTEIIQLFISVFFILYIRVKHARITTPLMWLSLFFYVKLASDLYGILNYTSWISTILTKQVLGIYRIAMGPIEVAMLTGFTLFLWSAFKKEIFLKQGRLFYLPAIVLFFLNWILQFYFNSNLILVFDTVRFLWIGIMIYALLAFKIHRELRIWIYTILAWNLLWVSEVILHEQTQVISEATSWVMFVMSELILAVGTAYYLIQVIIKPKLLKFEKNDDLLPVSLQKGMKFNLEKALEVDKIYQDPELTLTKLANRIDVPPADLTVYLNAFLSKNFNQFINEYRIAESKRLLLRPSSKKYTIEQIMYDVGFSSKSVFYTAFKKNTGMTPTAFRKANQETLH